MAPKQLHPQRHDLLVKEKTNSFFVSIKKILDSSSTLQKSLNTQFDFGGTIEIKKQTLVYVILIKEKMNEGIIFPYVLAIQTIVLKCCCGVFCFVLFCLVFFQGLIHSIWRFPGQGSNWSYNCWPTPQSQKTRDPSRICDLHHSSWQSQILNPLSEASEILVSFVSTDPQQELLECCFMVVFNGRLASGM